MSIESAKAELMRLFPNASVGLFKTRSNGLGLKLNLTSADNKADVPGYIEGYPVMFEVVGEIRKYEDS
jgi:hypothetical protein